MNTLYLLYLDQAHQGDPLFVQELAQRLAEAAPGRVPALIVHTGGEKLERTLEAEGRFPGRREGVIVPETPQQAALAERAARETGQDLVGRLTDEHVSAVSLPGADRGLLLRTPDGEVEAGAFGWVADLVKMRVVPVLSSLAQGPERAAPVPPGRALVAVAEALADFDVTVCFFAASAEAGDPLDALASAHSEPEVVRHAAQAGARLLVTDLDGLFAGEPPAGRRWKNDEELFSESKASR